MKKTEGVHELSGSSFFFALSTCSVFKCWAAVVDHLAQAVLTYLACAVSLGRPSFPFWNECPPESKLS